MKKAFGSYEIARFCRVAPVTVGRWIREGKLPHFRTGGGQRRVWAEDLMSFLQGLNMPVPPEVTANGRTRVLIVDDDPVARRLLLRFLRDDMPEAELHEASDGFEGGLKVASLMPALVILDLRLPGMDGYKVCRLIRADARLKHVRILCCSGYSAEEARRKALEAGADEFLPKPLEPAVLRAALRKVLA